MTRFEEIEEAEAGTKVSRWLAHDNLQHREVWLFKVLVDNEATLGFLRRWARVRSPYVEKFIELDFDNKFALAIKFDSAGGERPEPSRLDNTSRLKAERKAARSAMSAQGLEVQGVRFSECYIPFSRNHSHFMIKLPLSF